MGEIYYQIFLKDIDAENIFLQKNSKDGDI